MYCLTWLGRERDTDLSFHFLHIHWWFLHVPWPGIKPATLAYQEDALTTEPPGQDYNVFFFQELIVSKSIITISKVKLKNRKCILFIFVTFWCLDRTFLYPQMAIKLFFHLSCRDVKTISMLRVVMFVEAFKCTSLYLNKIQTMWKTSIYPWKKSSFHERWHMSALTFLFWRNRWASHSPHPHFLEAESGW